MSLGRAVSLSIAVHLLLALALSFMPRFEPPRPKPFVLELAAPTEQEKQDARRAIEKGVRQVVRQVEVPESLKAKSERPARFHSERDQAVLKETRAAASGLTQNRSAESSSARPGIPGLKSDGGLGEQSQGRRSRRWPNLDLRPRRPALRAEAIEARGTGDIAAGGRAPARNEAEAQESAAGGSRPLRLPNLARLGGLERGESTIGEELPADIKYGSFTALNTDRYVHYSFYARFEERFRQRWVKYFRAALFHYQNGGRGWRGDEKWTTRMEIVLDAQGRFMRGILHEGSGFKALDAAPVEAMHEVAQVPNPPAEMVLGDGTVRLMYEFNVQLVPRYAVGSE
jgi:TonB family protein